MPAPFLSDRSWAFDMGTSDLWSVIAHTHSYPVWWSWLRSFDGSAGFVPGAEWRCVVAPPLPYVVRFTIHFDEVMPARLVDTHVTGDIAGAARLELVEPTPGRCLARLRSSLAPSNRALRGFGRVARPLVEWGHDWVLDQGCRQFSEHALPGVPRTP